MSALEPFDVTLFVIMLSAVTPSLKVEVPVTASVLDKVAAPVTARVDASAVAPETFTASFNCIKVLSDALMAVPFTVNAPSTRLPVPPGVILMSAFESEVIELSKMLMLSMFVVVKVVAPDTASVELSVAAPVTATVDVAVSAPSIFVAPFT